MPCRARAREAQKRKRTGPASFSPFSQRVELPDWPETRTEVAQEGRLLHNLQAADLPLALVHFQNRLDYIIDVALRVDAPRNGQPQQLVAGLIAEHHRSDFHRAY